MKRMSTLLLVGVIVLSASFLYAAEALKIGIIDVDKVFDESTEGKKAAAELQAMVKAKQAAVDEKGAKLQEMQKALEAETDAAAKDAKQTELGKFSAEYQNLVAGSQQETQKKAVELRTGLLNDIKKILASIAAEEKLSAIFTSETVPYYSDAINVTAKVIKRYNESKKAK
jgi:outer membrane protein